MPVGYIKCNGATFDKVQYPKLALAYPNGTLPDLRGEFIRGWDDGRGVDAGREILSSQDDAIRNIKGSISFRNSSNDLGITFLASGAFSHSVTTTANDTNKLQLATVTGGADRFTFDASASVPTAEDNRPRNIAFLYIVKAA